MALLELEGQRQHNWRSETNAAVEAESLRRRFVRQRKVGANQSLDWLQRGGGAVEWCLQMGA